ncbi:MAG: efflux RND transporter periplasmic adaptor subunit [Bacteroidia bacterium]
MKAYILNIIQNPWVRNTLILAVGLFLGWLIFGGNGKKSNPSSESDHVHTTNDGTIWTCSMHPQIRQDEPGKCPICGMDLIPLEEGGEDVLLVNQLQMTAGAAKIAEIQTSMVQQAQPSKVLNLTGKIYPDETRIAELTGRFPGRIEKLFINFTGQQVYRGQKLATVYSPTLLTAQKELFEAIKLKEYSPKLYTAAKNKLLLWDLTEAQIEAIEASGEPKPYLIFYRPLQVLLLKGLFLLGDYIHEGMPLFEVKS